MCSVAAWQLKPNKNTHSILQMYVHKCRTFVPFIPKIEDKKRKKKLFHLFISVEYYENTYNIFSTNRLKTNHFYIDSNIMPFFSETESVCVYIYLLLHRIYSWDRKQGLCWNWIFSNVFGSFFFILSVPNKWVIDQHFAQPSEWYDQ